ncbi:Z1 domain-containing protein [Yinghuangia seranimata]|uniref:Z1 domain-containing protein n=1 Tax=Yinghuangia seranimata TaxID=408067 RepID=UPI00248CA629|nr:Z1 domain-containing protein [Yinghuangia seranimata]MDI2130880.1 Z1 domain-containing protein [Yinghuangia seranimata]
MSDGLFDVYDQALTGMTKGPRGLAAVVSVFADDLPPGTDVGEAAVRARLQSAGVADPLLDLWNRRLVDWDFATDAPWADDLPPRTLERRRRVYERLGLEDGSAEILDRLVPVSTLAGPTVISEDFEAWYRGDRDGWYWSAYRRVLKEKGWADEAVAGLDEASRRVVERLSDPTRPEAYQSKGLVVGYVQSGKTANFTGVIAKAIDAGYRMVIVLGGTLNLLRAQTQRRLDMELVGVENLLRGRDPKDPEVLEGFDYAQDPDWLAGRFLSHGERPSLMRAFDIDRLTTREVDYRLLQQGIAALEFEKHDPSLPLYAPENLHRTAARLMVVKKNKTILTKLLRDLKKIHTPLDQIPVLIIDDESDQASVNTSNPDKWKRGQAERTAINGLISDLLKLLPRSQYVGYTATPCANVFIDPSDNLDIFPKDFIISLDRPHGYMGVQDFHDLDSDVPYADRTIANSQEKAHVRGVDGSADDEWLRKALDMYVLTAMVKLYREHRSQGVLSFRHHTMLVHESVRVADHRELADRLVTMWYESGYTGAAGHTRLRELFDTDVQPVSRHRAEGAAVPDSFDELVPFLGAAVMRIAGDGSPVITVNGDSDVESGTADFDRRSIWKILVGGTKLSRGFTVEGLTVTYYRRTSAQSDTLMQMGRWFGFRPGYRDLVRLYIGREEKFGPRVVDLYKAFEAICRDEEEFRGQLAKYAETVDGTPQITPRDVPPLVAQHLPWLKPTATNKMYNADLIEMLRTPGEWVEPVAYPRKEKTADLRHNTALWRPLLDDLKPVTFIHRPKKAAPKSYEALVRVVNHADVLTLLGGLRWYDRSKFAPHLAYLTELAGRPDVLRDWLLVLPQQARAEKSARILGSDALSLFLRRRRRDPLFGAVSDPEHRQAPHTVAGITDFAGDPTADGYAEPARGALVLYPVVEEGFENAVQDGAIDPGAVVMAFAVVPPVGAVTGDRRQIRFRTRDSSTDR